MPKHVATSTPLAPGWSASSAVEGDLAAFIRELKVRDGADIGVHASISVARSLIAAGAVDSG